MLIEQVVQRDNLLAAYERVRANKGAAGVDGMSVDDLADFCREHWPRIREQLLGGTYVPQSVRKVEIPKPDGKRVLMLVRRYLLAGIIERALIYELSEV
jgi:retron-type reverse transcriptase